MTPSKSNLRCARLALGAPGLEGFTTALPHEQKGCPKRQRAEVHRSPSLQVVRKAPRLSISCIQYSVAQKCKSGVPNCGTTSTFRPSNLPGVGSGCEEPPRWRLARLLAPTKDPLFKTAGLEEKSPIGCSASEFLCGDPAMPSACPSEKTQKKLRPGSTKSSPKLNQPGRAQGT